MALPPNISWDEFTRAVDALSWCNRDSVAKADAARAKVQTANRHAGELVDRLLRERSAHRALLEDYFPRVAKARVRLAQWQEGDGSKPRQVLADLERILG